MNHSPPPAGGFGTGSGPGHFGPMGFGPAVSSDRFAVIAMVLGIMSIPLSLCCMLGVPLGVAAIVVSVMAVKRIDAAPHLHHGAKLARAGFWCGIGGTTLTILYIGFNILLPFFMSR